MRLGGWNPLVIAPLLRLIFYLPPKVYLSGQSDQCRAFPGVARVVRASPLSCCLDEDLRTTQGPGRGSGHPTHKREENLGECQAQWRALWGEASGERVALMIRRANLLACLQRYYSRVCVPATCPRLA